MQAASFIGVVQALADSAVAFLGILLLSAAAHKWLDRPRALTVMRDFVRVPVAWVRPAAAAAAVLECLLGAALLLARARVVACCCAALLFAWYLLLLLRAIHHGRRVDCGCGFGVSRSRLGYWTVLRNLALLALAIAGATFSSRHGGLVFAAQIAATQIAAALGMMAIYAVLDQVLSLQPPRRGKLL